LFSKKIATRLSDLHANDCIDPTICFIAKRFMAAPIDGRSNWSEIHRCCSFTIQFDGRDTYRALFWLSSNGLVFSTLLDERYNF
jgi:hypothetical protein